MHKVKLISAAGIALAALAAAAASATPVSAPANGKAVLLIPLKLTKVQDLDFGTVITSASSGTVTIDPSTGARTSSGGVTEVTSAAGARALFDFAGTANQQVAFTVTPPATLNDGNGNSITVANLVLSSTTATVDPTTLVVEVGVGGTIDVAANQADGIYSNTFSVTANYN